MRRTALLTALAAVVLFASCAAPPTSLGTLGGVGSRAHAVSPSGNVIGEAQVADGSWHAFAWANANSTMYDLHNIQPLGLAEAEKGRSAAHAVQDSTVVGTFGSSTAVVWSLVSMTASIVAGPDDPTLVQCRSGGSFTCGYRIGEVNANGSMLLAVVGFAPGIGNSRIVWRLRTSTGAAEAVPFNATDLTTDGLVVGWDVEPKDPRQGPQVETAYTWRAGGTRRPLPAPAGWNAVALAATADGVIIGRISDPTTGERRIVRWPAGGGQPVTIPVESPGSLTISDVADDGIALAERYDGTGTQFLVLNTTTGATAPITSSPSQVTAISGTYAAGASVASGADPSTGVAARWARPTP